MCIPYLKNNSVCVSECASRFWFFKWKIKRKESFKRPIHFDVKSVVNNNHKICMLPQNCTRIFKEKDVVCFFAQIDEISTSDKPFVRLFFVLNVN